MSVLATTAALPHMEFSNVYRWDRTRHSEQHFKSRTEVASIALPSIRQIIPELRLTTPPREYVVHARSRNHDACGGSLTTSTCSRSPNTHKRSRVASDDDDELMRAKQVPRIFQDPEPIFQQSFSPKIRTPTRTADKWTSPVAGGLPKFHVTSVSEPTRVTEASKPQITLPSLKATMNFDRDGSRARDMESSPSAAAAAAAANGQSSLVAGMTEPTRIFQSSSYDLSYGGPNRYQSHPSSPIGSYERAPFSAGAYSVHQHEMGRFGDMGGIMGTGPEAKQRKRRGNLPKETTDKLRAWFAAHLQHPYPTEDEKQDLMRQTGLQMNQISNWFINARRRQLPAMINNARAENEAARSNGSVSSKLGSSSSSSSSSLSPSSISSSSSLLSASEYDALYKREALPLSDGEGGSCDEVMDILQRRRTSAMKRGSV